MATEIYKGISLTKGVDTELQKRLIDSGKTNQISSLKPTNNFGSDFGSSFLNISSKIGSGVGDVIGGSKMFEGMGYALATPYINKLNTQTINNGMQLSSILDTKINEAKSSGDKIKTSSLLKAKQSLNLAPGVAETALSSAPSTKQILASAGSLALTASFGYKPSLNSTQYLKILGKDVGIGKIGLLSSNSASNISSFSKAIKATEYANKLHDATELGKTVLKTLNYGKKVTKNVAIGAGIMALGEAQMKKDATISDIVHQAEIGGGIAGAVELVSPALGYVASKSMKFLSPVFKTIGNNVIEKLTQISKGNYGVIDIAKNPMDILKTVESTKKNIIESAAQKTLDVIQGIKNLNTKFLDRFAPLEPIQKNAEKRVGYGIEPEKSAKVYTNVALLDQQAKNAADVIVKEFDDRLMAYKDILPKAKTALLHLDYIGRLKNGITKLPGDIAPDLLKLTASYDSFMKGLDPVTRQKIGQVRKVVNDWTHSYLNKRVDQGLISKEAADEMKRLYPDYIPHNVVLDAEESSMRGMGSSLNVSQSDIQSAIGSTRLITDPIEAIKERTYIAERLLAKNQFIKDLVNTGNKYQAIEGLRPITTAEQQTRRINLLTQLKELFKARGDLDKTIMSSNSNIRLLENKEKTILGKKFTSIINNYKASNLSKELSILVDRAKTMASEFEPKTKINVFLNKAKTAEERLFNIQSKISLLADKFKEAQVNKALDTRVIIDEVSKLKNEYYLKLDDTASAITGLKEELANAQKGTKSWTEETLSFFNNGIKESWVVPKDLAVAIKNLDFEPTPSLIKWMTWPTQVMKKMATTLNITFVAPNKFRDEQTAFVIGQSMIDNLSKKYGLSPKAINMSAEEFKALYRDMGGYGSSVFKDGDNALKGKLSKTGLNKVLDNANPLNIIDNINSAIEEDTRLKVFRKALESGLAPEDAAFVSRNASIDFSKMGASMKNLNKAIPFLNARVQGLLNTAKAATLSPEVFARNITMTSVYPTLLLQQWNSQFSSYNDVSQVQKNRAWIIMFGETKTNVNGEMKVIPQYIKIPKGEAQALFANPLQYYLDRQSGVDKRSVQRMLADTVGAASPISYQTWDSGNFLGSMISQFGPIASIPAGLAANKNLYTGAPIIPEAKKDAGSNFQSGQYTPEYIKSLTKTLNENWFNVTDLGANGTKVTGGIAPAQVEFVLNSMGGLSQDVSSLIDLTTGIINGQDAARQPKSNTAFGIAATYPGLRGVLQEDTGQGTTAMNELRQFKTEENAKQVNVTVMKNEMLDAEVKKLSKMDTTTSKNYLKDKLLSNEISAQDVTDIMKRIQTKKTIGVLKSSDDPDVKAAVILYQVKDMGIDEKKSLLVDLVNQGLIDANVINKIMTYQNKGVMDIASDMINMKTIEQKKAYLTDLVKSNMIDVDGIKQVLTVLKYEQQ